MTVNELRIGNVYGQFGNMHNVSWATLKELVDAPENQLWCKPIPITEELLLKFGFLDKGLDDINQYETHTNVFVFGEDDFFKVIFSEERYGNTVDRFKKIYFRGDYLIDIDYAHDLQNIFSSLTKTELILR